MFDKRVNNFQYPRVNGYYPLSYGENSSILKFEDGQSFLSEKNNLFIFTAALNSNNCNFSNSPLIVPTFYNIAKRSLQNPDLYYAIGNKNTYDVTTTLLQDDILSLTKGEINLIPQQEYFNNKVAITTEDLPNEAGIYAISNRSEQIQNVSYNYSRTESDLLYEDLENYEHMRFEESITQLFERLKSNSKINELWKWFVIFALVFLMLEILILKYFK